MRLGVITLGHVHAEELEPLTKQFEHLEQLVLDIEPRASLAEHRAELNRAGDAARAGGENGSAALRPQTRVALHPLRPRRADARCEHVALSLDRSRVRSAIAATPAVPAATVGAGRDDWRCRSSGTGAATCRS